MERIGYFALISNDMDGAFDALAVYSGKDVVEKALDNCKDALDFRRTGMHSDAALAGTVFVQFVALILICHIQKYMQNSDLFKTYPMRLLFDALDIVEAHDYKGVTHYNEITGIQRKLHSSLGVPAPGTL